MVKNFPDTIAFKRVPGDNVATVETPMQLGQKIQHLVQCIQIINAEGVKTLWRLKLGFFLFAFCETVGSSHRLLSTDAV